VAQSERDHEAYEKGKLLVEVEALRASRSCDHLAVLVESLQGQSKCVQCSSFLCLSLAFRQEKQEIAKLNARLAEQASLAASTTTEEQIKALNAVCIHKVQFITDSP
jgi:maleate cis-trans isomerase